nr:hybrid signal transduction histidine kinase M [Tanacetum cinerariifolium]
TSLTPFTLEELKVDIIVLSWIFTTLSDILQARLVVEHPQSVKEVWDLISNIFKDNKRSRTIALKAELRSIKLGDLTIDAYFRKMESLATILTTLRSPVILVDLLLLKSSHGDLVLILPRVRVGFGASCKYVRDVQVKSDSNGRGSNVEGGTSNSSSTNNTTNELLLKLLGQLGNLGLNNSHNSTTCGASNSGTTTSQPVAFNTNDSPLPFVPLGLTAYYPTQ